MDTDIVQEAASSGTLHQMDSVAMARTFEDIQASDVGRTARLAKTERVEKTVDDLLQESQIQTARGADAPKSKQGARDYVQGSPLKFTLDKSLAFRSVSPKPSTSVPSQPSKYGSSTTGVYVENTSLPALKTGKVDLSKLNKTPKRFAEFQAAGYQRNLTYQREEGGKVYVRGETQNSGRKSPGPVDKDKQNTSLDLPKHTKTKSPDGYNIYHKQNGNSNKKKEVLVEEEQGSLFSAVFSSGKVPVRKLKFVRNGKDERSLDQDKLESSRASDGNRGGTSATPSNPKDYLSRKEKNTSSRDTAGGTVSRSESHGSKSHSPGLIRQKSRIAPTKVPKPELETIDEKLNRKQILEAERKQFEKYGRLKILEGPPGAPKVKKITARDLKMPRGHSAEPTSRSIQSKDMLPKLENKLKNNLGSPTMTQLKPKDIASAAKRESLGGLASITSHQTPYMSTKQRNIYTSMVEYLPKRQVGPLEASSATKDVSNYQVSFASDKKKVEGQRRVPADVPSKRIAASQKEAVDPSKLRRFTPTDHLLQLFCGYYLTINVSKIPTRYHIGQGNNHEKVSQRFRKRKNIELMNHPGMGNIVWTPLTCKVLRYSNHSNFQKFTNLGAMLEPFEEKARDVAGLVQLLVDSKLFSVPDTGLLTSAFSKIFRKEPVYSIPTESLTYGNHIKGIMYISRKFLLAKTIIEHCATKVPPSDPFEIIPPTFFLTGDNFEAEYTALAKNVRDVQIKASDSGVWSSTSDYIVPIILKPGEYSNRGKGITIAYNDRDLKSLTNNYFLSSKRREFKLVAQTYLTAPLLFRKRKFDMRCYCLVTKHVDRMIVYWYNQGYARTSSYEYDDKIKDNMMVHLTNEAVQVKGMWVSHPRFCYFR